jgi:hydroxylamine reductase (hybrid-cluster protein)
MAEPVTVKLREPLEFGKEIIVELTFRPPTAKDLRKLQIRTGFELDYVLRLAGTLSGQPDVVIDKLAGEDLEEVVAVVSGFTPGSGRSTQTTS